MYLFVFLVFCGNWFSSVHQTWGSEERVNSETRCESRTSKWCELCCFFTALAISIFSKVPSVTWNHMEPTTRENSEAFHPLCRSICLWNLKNCHNKCLSFNIVPSRIAPFLHVRWFQISWLLFENTLICPTHSASNTY